VLELAPAAAVEGGEEAGETQTTDPDPSEPPSTVPVAGEAQTLVSDDLQSDVDDARTVGMVGIVIGALGLLAAIGAFVVAGRRT